MSDATSTMGSTVIPGLRYRNAQAAIAWLCQVFGFEQHLVVPGPNGTIAHAQLRLGAGMLMLSTVTESEFGRLTKQPDEIGGSETQSSYILVPDADLVSSKAQEAGAEIVIPIHDEEYGGRGFACKDLEGRLWYVGTYNPWAS